MSENGQTCGPLAKLIERPPRYAWRVVVQSEYEGSDREQVAPGKFERHTLATATCDAVVCTAADLYGTGRIDLVVGNFSAPDSADPVTIWKNRGKRR